MAAWVSQFKVLLPKLGSCQGCRDAPTRKLLIYFKSCIASQRSHEKETGLIRGPLILVINTGYEMATDQEREILATKILSCVGQQAARLPASKVTGFLAMEGQAWNHELMVIGRAVNAWEEDGRLPTALSSPEEITKYAKLVQESVAGSDGKCPMSWVTAGWGPKIDYNTRRSPFWRSIRRVVKGLGIPNVDGADVDSWASHLVWSNLYKVSPHSNGNPNNALCKIQFSGCAELLQLEFDTYRPSRALFLTGANWADPFLKNWKLEETPQFQYVQRVGLYGGAHCVVASHPQGKFKDVWESEVISAFNRSQQLAA